ncbi:C2 domain containing protein [Histomonas meleagridis]|uniref:C2 domain containing protein n=1 Tax=Histomonas meleagridis TaxID=135588 RepID=UPI00355A041B|nr:C2 domain containing protein [Histomonas meleagridis]KAH0796995.1 C2 domain containing protein [Histomonas meleagridis]
MDVNGLADPYCKAYFSNDKKHKQKTKIIYKTLHPVWNELIVFDLIGVPQDAQFCIDMKDKDLVSSDRISSTKILLSALTIGKVSELWIQMTPHKGVKKGGSLHILLHMAPKGSKPFVELPPSIPNSSSPKSSNPKSPEISEDIQTITLNLSTTSEESSQPPVITENDSSTPKRKRRKTHKRKEKMHRNLTLQNYVVYISCFTADNLKDYTSQPLSENVYYKLLHRGCDVYLVPVRSCIQDAKELMCTIGMNKKALLIQIGSTETTRHIKIVSEAFNETNFLVPDALNESPIGEKIFEEMEFGEMISNPINLSDVIGNMQSPFRLYHDQDRFLFNYFYAHGLRAVSKGIIGGCVFVQVPAFYNIPCNTQTYYVMELIQKILQLPQFQ